MFIRTKKIKGNEYAYLSENRWMKRKQKVRQETKKYLGRVYRFRKTAEAKLECNFDNVDIGEIIRNAVSLELKKHGFQHRKVWENSGCFVDLKSNKVYGANGRGIAIAMNNGFLADYTLRRLFDYKGIKNSYDLAKKLVESGLDVPKDVFVEIYRKLFKSFDVEDEIL